MSAQDFCNISVKPDGKLNYHNQPYITPKIVLPSGTMANLTFPAIKGCVVKTANGISALTIDYDTKETGYHVLELPVQNIFYIDADATNKIITIVMH